MFEDFGDEPEVIDDGGLSSGVDYDSLAAKAVAQEELNARLRDTYRRGELEGSEDQWPLRAVTVVDEYTSAYVRQRKKLPIAACPTPFPFVNRRCFGKGGRRGFAKGWHTVIAGASNYGKSTIAFNMAARILRYGWNVLYIALESDVEDTMTRIAACVSGVPLSSMSRGRDYDFGTEKDAHDLLIDQPGRLLVNREPIYKAEDIEGIVRALRSTQDLDVFIVDHMGLATTGDEKELAMVSAGVSRMMAAVAREERMLSIGLAQLKSAPARDFKRTPTAFDVMGGVPMVQDPDVMLMIDHTDASWVETPAANITEANIAIAKMRTGVKGTFRARIEWQTGRVVEVDKRGGNKVHEPVTEQTEVGL